VAYFRREDEAGGVAVIRFDRPPANAIDLAVTEVFGALLGTLERAPPKAVVVTGTGGTCSAGLDLKAVAAYGPEQRRGQGAAPRGQPRRARPRRRGRGRSDPEALGLTRRARRLTHVNAGIGPAG